MFFGYRRHPVQGIRDCHDGRGFVRTLNETVHLSALRVNDRRPDILFLNGHEVEADFGLEENILIELDAQIGAEQRLVLLLERHVVIFVRVDGHGVVFLIETGVPRTVFIFDGVGRTHGHGGPNRRSVGQRVGDRIDFGVSTGKVHPERQPFRRFVIYVQAGGITGKVRPDNESLVVEVADGGKEIVFFVTAGSRERVVLNDADTRDLVPPIRRTLRENVVTAEVVLDTAQNLFRRHVFRGGNGVATHVHQVGSIVIGVDFLEVMLYERRRGHTDFRVQRKLRLAFATFFRRDDDNPVRSPRTVDGGRARVFQDGNVFDVFGVQRSQGVGIGVHTEAAV